jgi:uncharacterized PurR-regulated membrane protein YhhQ (DUF165 family)
VNRYATPATLTALYVSTVLAANLLTSNLGLVAAGFGLLVPAGTYTAGLALGLRDAVQDRAGVRWVLAGIVVGTALSWWLGDGRVALASGAAFVVSELLDLAVYTPLRERYGRTAVVASNALGAVADTLLFLTLAGFPLAGAAVSGQLLVKAVWCTAAYLAVCEVVTRAVVRQPVHAEGA